MKELEHLATKCPLCDKTAKIYGIYGGPVEPIGYAMLCECGNKRQIDRKYWGQIFERENNTP